MCSNDELCAALHISENTLNAARMALINVRLVYYSSGKSKRQFSRYSFTTALTTSKFEANPEVNPATNPCTNAATNPADYNKPKQKPKLKKDANASVGTPKSFQPPSLDEVRAYFREKGYTEAAADKAWNYYDAGGWKDGKGNQVKNWKQKMQGVWFREENKAPPPPGTGGQTVTDPQDRSRTYHLRDYPGWHPDAPFDFANITRYKNGYPLRNSLNENIPGSHVVRS